MVIALWLRTEDRARRAGASWVAFDREILTRAQDLLTQPFKFVASGGSFRGPTRSPARHPHRGQWTSGPYTLRWFSKPLERITGDLWDFSLRGDNSLVLLVGDVTSHGLLAGLLAEGIPALFQLCLRALADPVDLVALRDLMEDKLGPVLAAGGEGPDCFIQATFLRVEDGPSWNGPHGRVTFVPGEAVRARHGPPPARPRWTLAMTAHLLGLDLEGGVPGIVNIREDAETLLASDGLFDQPVELDGVTTDLGQALIGDLPTFDSTRTLFHQVLYRWLKAVDSSGRQHDDTCIVSLRCQDNPLDGFDLRLMSWGDGTEVPTSGKSSVVVGTDNNDLLHIRIFDASGKRTDTEGTRLPARAAAVATLKQRLQGLLSPHVLTVQEREQVLSQVTSIVGLNLVTRLLDGESAAQDEFVQRFQRLVWKRVHERFGGWPDHDKAEAFQQVFEHLWAQLLKYSGGNLVAWVNRTAINKIKDIADRANRRGRAETTGADSSEVPDGSLGPPGQAQVGEDEREQADRMGRLRDAIERLSSDDRELLQLRLEGLTYEQIAERHDRPGWSARNLKYRMARIRETLRDHLGE
jgi:RNA polymerase sigma factor (sigma-70 family)